MATFNYVLGKKKDNDRYPVYLRITNRNTNTTISLDMEVVKSEWNEAGQRISIRRADDYDTRIEKEKNNDFLDSLIIRAKEVEKELKHRGVLNEMTAAQIKKAILEYSPNAKKTEGNGDFVQYWYGIAMETPKSQTKYQYALKAVINYHIAVKGIDRIYFRDITTDWVRGFLAYIKSGYQFVQGHGTQQRYKGLSPWSVNTYASCLKKVLNCAIDSDKLSADVMRGFRNFKPNIVRSHPYTLTIDDLRELLHYPFQTMRQKMVRDLFIFSFCTMGMNLTDIYHIDKKAIKWSGDAGEVKYIRNKTAKEIIVLINSHAEQLRKLIAPYASASKRNVWNTKTNSHRYFAFDYNYSTYKVFAGNCRKVVRQIRDIMGYDDHFTFYTARDSWSTILSDDYQLGQEYSDAGLGHSTKSLAGNHYIAVNFDKLFEVHADMLQRLFE